MKRLLAVVEGEGEVAAVPALLARVFQHHERYDWFVDERRTMKVGALAAFRKNIDKYSRYLRIQAPDAVLIVLDLDDGCPMNEAVELASALRLHGLPFPVSIVLAHREYEAWFLASLDSIAAEEPLLRGGSYDGEPESPRDCKGRLSAIMPEGQIYKPTLHQARFTRVLNIDAALAGSRSFRRLVHAVEEVTSGSSPTVTP